MFGKIMEQELILDQHFSDFYSQCSYQRPPDVCEAAFGFALGKLQSADVLQSGRVLIHLLTDY